MKLINTLFTSVVFFGLSSTAVAQQKKDSIVSNKNASAILTVKTACGQCQLGLPGEGCDLAVRIDSKAYFVDGTGIDEHGDAHADDGFCKAIRTAKVQGKVVDGRFKATSFVLVKDEKVKQ